MRQSEESRAIYRQIKELMGKPQQLFTQIDVPSSSLCNSPTEHTTLTLQMNWKITYWPATVGISYNLWKLHLSQILFYIMQ